MASGSSRSFNFGSDDVLCSYDDFAAPDSSSAGTKRPDLAAKDFPDGRMARPLVNIYEQEDHSREDLVSIVEKCMKKYADTLMRSLDGITGRLSQLEIHCYKLERSIGELRGDMVQGQNEADLKFKSLEKHMHEVHRAVQILRDKQELAETQKELAKLQTIQKESSPKPDERTSSPHPEPAKHDDAPQLSNNQLALVPSRPQAVQPQQQQHLALPQPQLSQLPVQQDQYTVSQPTTFFSVSQAQAQQLPPGYHFVQVTPAQPPQAPVQPPQQQAAPPAQQVTPPQVVNAMPQQPAPQFPQQWAPQQPNLNPNQQQFTSQGMPPSQAAPPSQPVPPQQWAHQQPNLNPNQQQFTSQGMPPSQAAPPSQSVPPSGAPQRPHPPAGYSPYPPHQPSNPITETYAVSMPIPASYSTAPQPGMNRSDMAPVGYGSQGNARQPIPNQGSFMAAPQMGKGGYTNGPPYMQGNLPGYNSGPYNYPPSNAPGAHLGPQQLPRNHPYSEFVEKAVGMGYPREQVTNVALKMTENGQAMDFNALLDRLNGVSTPSPRAWSG